ncbi:MAG: DUF2130 domain-containing protein [Candidatus Woesebacteria bacterium]
MTSQITCPHCHTPISLDDALTGQIKTAVEQQLSTEYEQKLSKEQKNIEQRLKEQFAKDTSTELTFLKEQLEDKKQKLETATKKELELRKKEVEFEEKERNRELEIQRQLDSERKRIRETTEAQMVEQQRQKDLENEKKLSDMKRALDEAQRKANQGSQQTQGEVRELELEKILRETFRDDLIEPVGKGVHGADVRQIVRSSRGTVCGVILWESKQTKVWSEGWIGKLKEDLRAEKADIPIIVTTAYNEANWMGQSHRDGVWICNFQLFLPLALALRKSLIDSGRERAMAQNRGEKSDLIYSYVTSQAFRQQVEALVEVFTEMQMQITKERAAMEKIWKSREGQVQRLILSTGTIYGSVQGLAGTSVVPELHGLELETITDGS